MQLRSQRPTRALESETNPSWSKGMSRGSLKAQDSKRHFIFDLSQIANMPSNNSDYLWTSNPELQSKHHCVQGGWRGGCQLLDFLLLWRAVGETWKPHTPVSEVAADWAAWIWTWLSIKQSAGTGKYQGSDVNTGNTWTLSARGGVFYYATPPVHL